MQKRDPFTVRFRMILVALMAVLACNSAFARDWFVAPDARDGDGTRLKPFRDPYMALRAVEAGDAIHIAAGVYYGRYDRSYWEIDRPRIKILGGYSRDFSRRTPWQTPSVFAVFREYEGPREANLMAGKGEHAGIILDGLFFDSGGRNVYGEKPASAIRRSPVINGPIAVFQSPDVVIRNCVFANSTGGAVQLSGEGSRFENNLVVNIIGPAMLTLREYASGNKRSMTIKSNTFAFAHDEGSPPLGRGTNNGTGIRVSCPANIEDNAFIACANYAVCIMAKADQVAVDRNVFWMGAHANLARQLAASKEEISDSNMDEIEDLGLQSAKGNTVADPGLSGLEPAWVDAFSRHFLINYARPPREAVGSMRAQAGLPAFVSPPAGAASTTAADSSAGALAPYMDVADCLSIRTKGRGTQPVALKAEWGPGSQAVVAPNYVPITWEQFMAGDSALANKRIELRAGLDGERAWYMLRDVPQASFVGFNIMCPGQGPSTGMFLVYARRGSRTQREYDEGTKYSMSREVEDAYLIRGVCRLDTGDSRQKATMIVESILPAPSPAPVTKRPPGRDWFVRAGATGGDGTRSSPFRDPFQAMEKAAPGDVIHVAAGDYYGKLRCGNWKVPVRDLAMLGGYDAGFTRRDPWSNPTRLVLAEESRAKRSHTGVFLESAGGSDGFVLDGFIFDGSTVNEYAPGGGLDLSKSSLNSMVVLRGGNGIITVRNCTFVNACGSAITIRSAGGTFENNIVLNTSGRGVEIESGGPYRWTVRNNTLLFASDSRGRGGSGLPGADGTLLLIGRRGKADIEHNIFGFAEQCGIRCEISAANVSLNDNMFGANLHSHLTDTKYLWAQAGNWERRVVGDAGYASARGNTFATLSLSLDKTYADRALARLFTLSSRYGADEWKRIAAAVGASVVPPTPVAAPAADPSTRPAEKERSLEDLLAELRRQKDSAPDKPPAAPTGPPYCPAYDWQKALDLAPSAASSTVGARRVKLDVSFAPAQPR